MDVVYRLRRATAAEIHAALPDAPTYTTVRGLLRVLESKGHVSHEEQGRQYVYLPRTPVPDAGSSHLAHIVSTFFAGSPAAAMDALLGSHHTRLTEEELERMTALVEQARASARRARKPDDGRGSPR